MSDFDVPVDLAGDLFWGPAIYGNEHAANTCSKSAWASVLTCAMLRRCTRKFSEGVTRGRQISIRT